ncbi:hypothetical protein L484_012290 [Morus notabilis]|uniref:Uncharacterized protein n=1 Tax=Morus notabilis TaxID=981085 RepID=W9QXF6_9ROSA|nr:hypothetical protein L484_012290 [Morus notabilis]
MRNPKGRNPKYPFACSGEIGIEWRGTVASGEERRRGRVPSGEERWRVERKEEEEKEEDTGVRRWSGGLRSGGGPVD